MNMIIFTDNSFKNDTQQKKVKQVLGELDKICDLWKVTENLE